MPRGNGVFVLESLSPPPPTILLTTFDDDQALFAGLRAGARGFLLKDISLEVLLDACVGWPQARRWSALLSPRACSVASSEPHLTSIPRSRRRR